MGSVEAIFILSSSHGQQRSRRPFTTLVVKQTSHPRLRFQNVHMMAGFCGANCTVPNEQIAIVCFRRPCHEGLCFFVGLVSVAPCGALAGAAALKRPTGTLGLTGNRDKKQHQRQTDTRRFFALPYHLTSVHVCVTCTVAERTAPIVGYGPRTKETEKGRRGEKEVPERVSAGWVTFGCA